MCASWENNLLTVGKWQCQHIAIFGSVEENENVWKGREDSQVIDGPAALVVDGQSQTDHLSRQHSPREVLPVAHHLPSWLGHDNVQAAVWCIDDAGFVSFGNVQPPT